MKKLSKDEMLQALAAYGFELNRPGRILKGEEVLYLLLKEKDPRLLEGFPVVYDNVLNSQKVLSLDPETLTKNERSKLLLLLYLSYLLFRLFGEDRHKIAYTRNLFSKLNDNWKDAVKEVEQKFNRSDFVQVNDTALATDRLKKQFRNYAVHFGEKSLNEPQLDLELELHLSQFFTPKQKELIKKRLKNEEMTKTEREYYSRAVNKRLKALSDPGLQDFASSLTSLVPMDSNPKTRFTLTPKLKRA
jgi:hypothetical protein